MNVQEQQAISREGELDHRRRRNSWLAIFLAVLSIPLIIIGLGILMIAGATIAGVALLGLTILLLVAGFGLLIAAGIYFVLSKVSVETRKFSVSGRPQIVVNNEVGTIHVNTTSDVNTVSIQTKRLSQRFGKAANNSWVSYDQSEEGNKISAEVERLLVPDNNLPQGIDFNIKVPKNTDLELNTGVGDIWVSGISGQLSLESDTGSIYVRHGLLNGNSAMKSILGSINFHEAIDPFGAYLFETETGSVNVTLPDDTAFDLDASANLGSVTTVVPGMKMAYRTNNEVHGDAGLPPRASMRIKSNIGSVSVFEESDSYLPNWGEN
jgi:hypothetical protein